MTEEEKSDNNVDQQAAELREKTEQAEREAIQRYEEGRKKSS